MLINKFIYQTASKTSYVIKIYILSIYKLNKFNVKRIH